MKVLFLCDKNSYVTKMSRVRFHSIEAISGVCELKWSGTNWENYDNNSTVQENIDILYADMFSQSLAIKFNISSFEESLFSNFLINQLFQILSFSWLS